ncbi:hypothetical protein ALC57_15659 [Trachymyrmex cornetzi]|uniref:Uncharacterized protein n=1 Tax=Trachymyrmex cornetzi TaxID=471704 RepID=A0A151IWT5_9HYME|nr:hypothetical protein ALC57_15659 [Trachymyrmex cornetzi]
MVSHFRIKWLNVMSAIDYSHYDGEKMETRELRARTSEEAGKRTEAEKDDRSEEHEEGSGEEGPSGLD